MGYMPLSMTEVKAPLLDEWEVPATEVIVESQLGEGAFGEVYKGVIKGPLTNPKISPMLKQSIGIPVAIKLLKSMWVFGAAYCAIQSLFVQAHDSLFSNSPFQ